MQKDDGGWWQGELNGKVGMFPSNFVSEDGNAAYRTGQALYNYESQGEGEVSIKEGDSVTIESEDEQGWMYVYNAANEYGRVPADYIQENAK